MKKHLIRLFTVSAVVSLIAAFLLSMPLVQRYNLHQTQTQLKSILLILSAQGESCWKTPMTFQIAAPVLSPAADWTSALRSSARMAV